MLKPTEQIQETAKPVDTLRDILIYQRNRVIFALENYLLSGKLEIHFQQTVKPKIQSLFLQVKPEFEKSQENKWAGLLILEEGNIDKIIELYYSIDEWLNDKKLISFTNERRIN